MKSPWNHHEIRNVAQPGLSDHPRNLATKQPLGPQGVYGWGVNGVNLRFRKFFWEIYHDLSWFIHLNDQLTSTNHCYAKPCRGLGTWKALYSSVLLPFEKCHDATSIHQSIRKWPKFAGQTLILCPHSWGFLMQEPDYWDYTLILRPL
jgi:hypothetical protein